MTVGSQLWRAWLSWVEWGVSIAHDKKETTSGVLFLFLRGHSVWMNEHFNPRYLDNLDFDFFFLKELSIWISGNLFLLFNI